MSLISDPDPGSAQIKGLGPQTAGPGVCHQTQTVFILPRGGGRRGGGEVFTNQASHKCRFKSRLSRREGDCVGGGHKSVELKAAYKSVNFKAVNKYVKLKAVNKYVKLKAVNKYVKLKAINKYVRLKAINKYVKLKALNKYTKLKAVNKFTKLKAINKYIKLKAINKYVTFNERFIFRLMSWGPISSGMLD